MELSVPPENANELTETKILNSDDHVYLKQLQAMFHNMFQKFDEKDTISDLSVHTLYMISKDE